MRFAATTLLPRFAIALVFAAWGAVCAAAAEAPQFTHSGARDWINSPPLTLADFDCWNCYRSIPWLKDLEARLGPKGLALMGVHSPEFAHEKAYDKVAAKVKEFGIRHPVMLDNDFSYWNALGNRYWPAFYVIDKQGRLRGAYVGETHAGDRRAREIETLIVGLLAE